MPIATDPNVAALEGMTLLTSQDSALTEYDQFPARAQPMGEPTKDQHAAMMPHVLDPSILETNTPFVWGAVVSNQNVDSYFTRMHESSLRNYAADAQAGISFMNSHRTGGRGTDAELPMGRSFIGKYTGGQNARVEETFYTLRDLQLNGLPTNNFINGLRSGVVRDVSIGFYGGEYRCSICDRNWITDWDCPHWPGDSYAVLDKKGNETGETQTAYLWIHDAHQAEVSAVYDGACPGAMVIRAQQMTEAGLIKPQKVRLLEARYRIRLPNTGNLYRGVDTSTVDLPTMLEADVEQPTGEEIEDREPIVTVAENETVSRAIHQAFIDSVDESLKRAGAPEGANVRWLADELIRLRSLADDGMAYRADLVKDATTEGVRAFGADFSTETYKPILETAPLDAVKRMRDDWRKLGDQNFKAGRQTVDVPDRNAKTEVSVNAYKVR